LQECQQDEHTSLLLTTPLQVTIVLLITKDGGRPPSQREALFQEYWNTIFRREKAKAKGVIRTEEALLFELHAKLGYLLHNRSATKNVRSLLPAKEFKQVVVKFLKEKDSLSPHELIDQHANQMVKEAGERLVLLVAPEPEYVGFELRPLQEFFAAVYLAQTARNTQQRFERLKAIAPYPHWRNVALFFAGRVVRNFSGESANILELVCRSIDRDSSERFLKRGAWLALDIAADGIFTGNRDLQYSALEYGLSVIDTSLNSEGQDHLMKNSQRLTTEDIKDILRPILEQKAPSLPLSFLISVLEVYGNFVELNSLLIHGLETLLSSNNPYFKRRAFSLAIKHKVTSKWLAKQFVAHWQFCSNEDLLWEQLGRISIEDLDYLSDILKSLSPTKNQRDLILGRLLTISRSTTLHRQPPQFKKCSQLRHILINWFWRLSAKIFSTIYLVSTSV